MEIHKYIHIYKIHLGQSNISRIFFKAAVLKSFQFTVENMPGAAWEHMKTGMRNRDHKL